jgi:exonuclease VII large subunit
MRTLHFTSFTVLRVARAFLLCIAGTFLQVLVIQPLLFRAALSHTSQEYSIDSQSDMAAPIPTMTVTFDIPVLAQLLQANHDLRREVSNLRTELSARVQAVETHLVSQRTDNSTLTVPSQDLDHNASAVHEDRQHEDLHIDQDLLDEINGNLQQDARTQQDVQAQQNYHAQQNDLLDQDDSSGATSRNPSSSVDEGLTIMDMCRCRLKTVESASELLNLQSVHRLTSTIQIL